MSKLLEAYVGEDENFTQEELLNARKPKGFWEEKKNILAVAKAVMDKYDLRVLPSYDELQRMGYSSLVNAITMKGGGMQDFRKLLGEKSTRRKAGDYKTLDETLSEIKNIMKDRSLRNLPRSDLLVEWGYSKLVKDINYNGGFVKIRQALGEDNIRKSNGQWKDREFVRKEVKRVMKEHGLESLPCTKKLIELGESSLGSAIVKYHGGMRAFRSEIGQEQKEIPKGTWKNLDYVVSQAREIMDENGFETLPGQTTLTRLGYGSFVAGISNHGGIRKLREHLGQKQPIRNFDTWKSLDFALDYAKGIIKEHKLDKLPNGDKLAKMGYSALNNAIFKYHGGIRKFRRKLGEEVEVDRYDDIRDKKYVIAQARKIMEDNGYENLPGANELNRKGYSSFVNAVNRHHGGMTKFKRELGQQTKKPKGYWNEWKNARKELKRVIRELKRFPNQKDLQSRNLGTLANSINRVYGGINAVRSKMGYEIEIRDREFYRNLDNVKLDLDKIIKQNSDLNGEFPSSHWLQKNGYSGLSEGIRKYHGGFRNFRETMGADSGQVEMGSWKKLEYAVEQAKKFMEDNGFDYFPGGWTLNKLGYSSLMAAVQKYHGGFPAFRKKLDGLLGNKIKGKAGLLETYVGRENE